MIFDEESIEAKYPDVLKNRFQKINFEAINLFYKAGLN